MRPYLHISPLSWTTAPNFPAPKLFPSLHHNFPQWVFSDLSLAFYQGMGRIDANFASLSSLILKNNLSCDRISTNHEAHSSPRLMTCLTQSFWTWRHLGGHHKGSKPRITEQVNKRDKAEKTTFHFSLGKFSVHLEALLSRTAGTGSGEHIHCPPAPSPVQAVSSSHTHAPGRCKHQYPSHTNTAPRTKPAFLSLK